MKKILLTVLALLLISSGAWASNIKNILAPQMVVNEQYRWVFSVLYDWGTLYQYQATPSPQWNPINQNPYNAQKGLSGHNSIPDGGWAPDGKEDTYGIVGLDRIEDSKGNILYQTKPSDSFMLAGLFYGFDDARISIVVGGKASLQAVGGYFELWEIGKNTGTSMASAVTAIASQGPLNIRDTSIGPPWDDSLFKGISDVGGTLILSGLGNMVLQYSLDQYFNFAALTGFGTAFVDVGPTPAGEVGELNSWVLKKGEPKYPGGYFTDIVFDFSSFPTQLSTWTVAGTGEARMVSAVPVPASVLLLGSGLLGLVGVSRIRLFKK